jgi:hypothetical protein
MPSIDCLQEVIRVLVTERQAMRDRGAGRDELEWNRLALAGRQRQLSRALIEEYGRAPRREAA